MANESVLETAINFLIELGVFEYLLPFILIFTLLYAILEKTKVLGTEKIDEITYTKRNLNAMVSFVIALMVIVSKEVVGIIIDTSIYIVILLLASIFFMILVGSFSKEKETPFYLEGKWKNAFMWIMFMGLSVIFLSAMKTKNNESWLSTVLNAIGTPYLKDIFSTLILIILVGGFVYLITKEDNNKKENEGDT